MIFYNFKTYFLIISWTLVVPAFCDFPSPASEIAIPEQTVDFDKDLTFIKKTLLEDHPGVCNSLDPTFCEKMEENFKIAKQKLLTTQIAEEKGKILEEFGRSFDDAHLWIQYNFKNAKITGPLNKKRPFSIEQIKEGICWIDIPTFHLSKEQVKDLRAIINSLPEARNQTVIFDLRGNGGGNSFWGNEILKALFGQEYTNQQLALYKQHVYVEWRISQGNLDHIKNLIAIFEKDDPSIGWLKKIYKGMLEASLRGDNYYSEIYSPPPSSTATTLFTGKVMAIIDRGCGSACLNFLDGLKAMNSDVTFIGEPTGADSVYMELRTISLPSGKGTLGFPIKVYKNRPRGHNVPHTPDLEYKGNLQDTAELKKTMSSIK